MTNKKEYMTNYMKNYRLTHDKESPEKAFNRFKKYYCTLKGRAMHMLNNARRRAKNLGMDYDLDFDFLIKKLEGGVCEITGIPLLFKINGGKGHRINSFSPSLDRIDNTKGYTKDNVQIVCWIYNRAKGAFPIADLMIMVQSLLAKDSPQIQ